MKAATKRPNFLAGFSVTAPPRTNPNRFMILTETKSGDEGIQHFIGKEGEVIASSKKQIDSGGSAVVVLKSTSGDPMSLNNSLSPATSQSKPHF